MDKLHYFCNMVINVHTHRQTSSQDTTDVINWRYGHEDMPVDAQNISVGIHPWDAELPIDWEAFREAATRALAIGECGIDKSCNVPMSVQEDVFRRQITIAEELGKPVIVHCVKAYGRLSEIRKTMHCHEPWIVHGCYASTEWIRTVAGSNIFLSLGPMQLGMKRGSDIARAIPTESLLVETDESEESLSSVIERIGEVRGEDVSETVGQNAQRALKIFL